MTAGILRGWRAAAAAAAASSLYAAVEHAAESAALAPVILDHMFPGAAVVSTVAMLAIVAALLALYAREIERAEEAERRSTARALETERALAEVVRSAPDGILIMSQEGIVEAVNDAVVRMSGWAESELVGKHLVELPGIGSPEVAESLRGGLARTATGESVLMQSELRRKDGGLLVVETNGQLARRPDGTLAVQVIIRDITARVVAERDRKRLEDELLDARRMEGIGRLAGGIAHDFRNLLTPVIVNARSISDGTAPGEARTLANEIEIAAQKANELTGQLLAFARRQMLETKVLDLGKVIRGLEPILRRLVREDVRLDLRIASGLAPVKADQSQIEQVIVNLVANACEAMPDGGSLLIATAPVSAPGPSGGADLPHVSLLVSDTGRGMSDDVRRRVFEPFFTTKGAGRGVGLGLATVHGIVTQSVGTVQVESEPGLGSTFRVLLPVAEGLAEGTAAPLEVEPLFPPGMRVLVADDAPLVRGTVARVLRSRGVEVVEAEDGLAAMAVARTDAGRFDLLVTDVVMPGMAGPALAVELRKLQPDVAVLFISGYADEGVVAGGQVVADVDFLPKPFTPSQLVARVGEALHRARRRPGKHAG